MFKMVFPEFVGFHWLII